MAFRLILIIFMLIPVNSFSAMCAREASTGVYHLPVCDYWSGNCSVSCDYDPVYGSNYYDAYPPGGYCVSIYGVTITVEYGGWSREYYQACSGWYHILVAPTSCTSGTYIYEPGVSTPANFLDTAYTIPPYTGEYPVEKINYSESSISMIQDFSILADIPADEIYVYRNSEYLGMFPNGFNPLSVGLNLSCSDYIFQVVSPTVYLDQCHLIGWSGFSYVALQYKINSSGLGPFVYSVDVSSLSLPVLNNYEITFTGSLYYGVGEDSLGNSFELGDSQGSNTVFFSSSDNVSSFILRMYDSSWVLLGETSIPAVLLSSTAEEITWGYSVYDLQSNYITDLPFGVPGLIEFALPSDQGVTVPLNIEYCGDYTCLVSPIVASKVTDCPSTLQYAWYYDDLFTQVVVPSVLANGVYSFTDYNNQSGIVNLALLDCNSLPVTQVVNGEVPTCSVTGSGGRVQDGRYRGASTKQRLIQKNVGGGYERQINN